MYKKLLLALSSLLLSGVVLGTPSNPPADLTPTEALTEGKDKSTEKKLVIENAWARPSMSPSNNSAIYLSIKNDTDKDVVLAGASAPDVANNVELHKSYVDEKGVTKMTGIDKIVIPAHSTINLEPGGTHIMLFELRRRLGETGGKEDKFNAELKFEEMEPQTIEVLVKSRF